MKLYFFDKGIMSKITITLQPIDHAIQVKKGTPLIDVLHEYGVEFPCGGKGTCGSCKIKLLEGEIEVDEIHRQKLAKLKLENSWRLACFCKAESDLTLEISQFDTIILADNTSFEFTPQTGYGIAVDLGTTTIVTQIVNLENGHILDSVSDVNPQGKYGGDLIARIQACLDGKQAEMQAMVHTRVGAMLESMLEKHRIEVSKVSLVGNTVMHHIFCGLDVQALSMYPFESMNLGAQNLNAGNLGWNLPASASIQFYPSIGSFVGSDILAGIAATKMLEKEKYSLLIDLGTNGEIAVGNKHKVLCASTAAGPAYEGANISHGMRATTGAISSVSSNKGTLTSHVIGNAKAKGICGSGLIDVMAILLEQQQIGMFGEINSGEEEIAITKKVSLTQQDIREFQLAKAAIATGVQILLNDFKITMDEVENVYIAGGFGNFLNLKNVIRTGTIEAKEEQIRKLGNTALIGAKMFLFENETFINNILNKTRHINLEGESTFQDIYIDKMLLV